MSNIALDDALRIARYRLYEARINGQPIPGNLLEAVKLHLCEHLAVKNPYYILKNRCLGCERGDLESKYGFRYNSDDGNVTGEATLECGHAQKVWSQTLRQGRKPQCKICIVETRGAAIKSVAKSRGVIILPGQTGPQQNVILPCGHESRIFVQSLRTPHLPRCQTCRTLDKK
jgi:hypothetical protein